MVIVNGIYRRKVVCLSLLFHKTINVTYLLEGAKAAAEATIAARTAMDLNILVVLI